jgi:multidrug efflux pump subunit AcrA (membrane-fusion protein)
MKRFILFLIAGIFALNIYASEQKIVQIESMLEGKVIMCVEPGDRVIKGQPLFYVDPASLKVQRQKNKDAIKFDFEVVERDKKLAKTHNVKLADLQQDEYNLVNTIQDAKITEQNILNSYYFAPFDGVITKVVNYSGSGIGDGNEVVDISELKSDTNAATLQKSIQNKDQVAQVGSMTEGMIALHVKLGEEVKKGQLLFNVDTVPGDDTTYIGPQKIKLENALKYYKANYDRLKNLYNSRTVKLADLQEAELNFKNAKNDLKSFNTNVKQSYYYAPFKGIVTKIINYNGCIGDGNEVIDVTRITPHTNTSAIKTELEKSPTVAQVDSLIEGILNLNVKEGQHVKKGELLFKVDTTALDNQKKINKSYVKYCSQEYNRQKNLLAKHAVSLSDFQTAEYNLVNAIADLKTTELNIQNSSYYAPFDGVVSKVINSTGSAIGDGSEVVDVTKDATS